MPVFNLIIKNPLVAGFLCFDYKQKFIYLSKIICPLINITNKN